MALPVNINNLINKDTVEWERKEFKKGWNEEAFIHTICAFANDINNWGGGYIIIGFDEENGIPLLPPIGLKKNQIDAIQKKIIELCNRLQPTHFPIIEPVLYLNKHILVIWCPPGDNKPYSAPSTLGIKGQKQYYVRRGSKTVKANDIEQRQLIELTAKIPYDDRINHHASIDDLNLRYIQEYLKEIGSKLFDEAPKLDFRELCHQMQIVRGAKEYLRPTNVGLLFFSENPQKYFKSAYIDVAVYKDNYGIEYEQKEFRGPLHYQLRGALDFINRNIIKETVRKVEGQAEALRFYNYPYEAVEEALANAVYHRSYEHPNQIEVHVRTDKIEIISYPGALPPVDNESLKKERVVARIYRNRRIGEFLKELNLTEAKGTGFPTIRRAMSKNGSPKPLFEMDSDKTYFLTILRIHPNSFKISQEINLLEFCKNPKTRKEIFEDNLKISNQTKNYRKYIAPLIEKGFIDLTSADKLSSKSQMYVISKKGFKYMEVIGNIQKVADLDSNRDSNRDGNRDGNKG